MPKRPGGIGGKHEGGDGVNGYGPDDGDDDKDEVDPMPWLPTGEIPIQYIKRDGDIEQ